MPDLLPRVLAGRLDAELGVRVVEATPIDPGVIHNNRLVRLVGADGRQLVLKSYYRDDRQRLEREFGAFAFLRARGIAAVPIPYLRDDECYAAVYSLEPGRTKSAAELTVDDLTAIGAFAGRLHRLRPEEADPPFTPAFRADSFADRVGFLRRRLAGCLDAAAAADAYPELRAVVAEVDLAAALERLIAGATAGMSAADLARPVP